MAILRLFFLSILLSVPLNLSLQAVESSGAEDREYTVSILVKIAKPVLSAAADGRLADALANRDEDHKYRPTAPLEAFGRTMCGIAPWLSLGPDDTAEGKIRGEFLELSRRGIVASTKKGTKSRMLFSGKNQPLVDAAFLAQAILEAPHQLWDPLLSEEKADLIDALKETRSILPARNNWLLFSALVEAAIWKFTGEEKLDPIEQAIEQHDQWYLGDGTYGDGPQLHWDYYNSYVIQPALLVVLDVCEEKGHPLAKRKADIRKRAQRYAEVQERMISPEGSYPVIGRSSTYRFGAFQHLTTMAFRHDLPPELNPAGVRCAMTAVIRRTIEMPGTFDEQGWLRPGAVGYQPSLREGYINIGSLYLCLFGMKHLGLPAEDPFWTASAAPWTQKKIWAGEDLPADHAK